MPTSTHQPERLVCSPARAGGVWELRLGLQSSDPRERTGVGCVNTVREWHGLIYTTKCKIASYWEAAA